MLADLSFGKLNQFTLEQIDFDLLGFDGGLLVALPLHLERFRNLAQLCLQQSGSGGQTPSPIFSRTFKGHTAPGVATRTALETLPIRPFCSLILGWPALAFAPFLSIALSMIAAVSQQREEQDEGGGHPPTGVAVVCVWNSGFSRDLTEEA